MRASFVFLAILGISWPILSDADQPEEFHASDDLRVQLLEVLQRSQIQPVDGGYLRPIGAFPEIQWDPPYLGRLLWEEFPVEVRWFDADAVELETPDQPGLYVAVATARPPEGRVIQRARSFFFVDPSAGDQETDSLHDWLAVPAEAPFGLRTEVWDRGRPYVERLIERNLWQGLAESEEAAVLVAALAQGDIDRWEAWMNPAIWNHEIQWAIRRQLQGAEATRESLERPESTETMASILRPGSPGEAGLHPELSELLHEFCLRWLEEAGGPFTLLVARNEVIVFHETFDAAPEDPADNHEIYPLYSLTKLLTGTMLGMFVDQGLMKLDDPFGRFLNGFPVEEAGTRTVRGAMMHVTGLDGHNRWGGMTNAWLDQIVREELATVSPAYVYAGVPYDLVGVAMQEVTGQPFGRLFQEHLFQPLEMQEAFIDDLGMGARLRTIDLARVGQLWLNQGAYGGWRFFSPTVWEELLPRSYEELYPGMAARQADYGMGIRWAWERHPRAGEEGVPDDAVVPGRRTLGHGAYSGSVLRIDLDNDLVIAAGRHSAGPDHRQRLAQLLELIAESVVAGPGGKQEE